MQHSKSSQGSCCTELTAEDFCWCCKHTISAFCPTAVQHWHTAGDSQSRVWTRGLRPMWTLSCNNISQPVATAVAGRSSVVCDVHSRHCTTRHQRLPELTANSL